MSTRRVLIKGLRQDVKKGLITNVKDLERNVQYVQSQLGAIHGNLKTTQGGTAGGLTMQQNKSLVAMRRLAQRTGKLETKSLRKSEAWARNSFGTAIGSVMQAQFGPARATVAASALGVKGLVKAGALTAKGGQLAMQELKAGSSDAATAAAREHAADVAHNAAQEKVQEAAQTAAERAAAADRAWQLKVMRIQRGWQLDDLAATQTQGTAMLMADGPAIAGTTQQALVSLHTNGSVTIGDQEFAPGYDPAALANAIAAENGFDAAEEALITRTLFIVRRADGHIGTPEAFTQAVAGAYGDQPGFKMDEFLDVVSDGFTSYQEAKNAAEAADAVTHAGDKGPGDLSLYTDNGDGTYSYHGTRYKPNQFGEMYPA